MKGIVSRRIGYWETLFRRLSKICFLPRSETSCIIIPIAHFTNLRVLVQEEPAVDFANRLCNLLERAYCGHPFRAEARRVLWQIERKRHRYREREALKNVKVIYAKSDS